MIIALTKENYDEFTSKSVSLVELWAPWCVYCRRLSPVLDRVAEKRGDTLPIGKINVDEQPELASALDDSVIPALYIFKNGQHGDKLVAPASQDQLEKWIDGQI